MIGDIKYLLGCSHLETRVFYDLPDGATPYWNFSTSPENKNYDTLMELGAIQQLICNHSMDYHYDVTSNPKYIRAHPMIMLI